MKKKKLKGGQRLEYQGEKTYFPSQKKVHYDVGLPQGGTITKKMWKKMWGFPKPPKKKAGTSGRTGN